MSGRLNRSMYKGIPCLAFLFAATGHSAQEASIKSITRVTKITWDSEFGKAYRVLGSICPGGPWEPLGELLPGTGLEMCAYDETQDAGKRFYRLEATDITPLGMVPVPGATYEMGDHFGIDNMNWSLPVHTVRVDSLYMDATEVTNAAFCAFLNAAKRAGRVRVSVDIGVYSTTDPSLLYSSLRPSWSCIPDIFYDESSDAVKIVAEREEHPAIDITWHGAAAYCNWRSEEDGLEPCYDPETWECDFGAEGYRLPTEAEWEYAARGGLRYSIYPWGDEIDGSRANYWGSGDPHDNDRSMGVGAPTTPVAFYAPNGYGLYDMVGNALELCNDQWWGSYYEYCVQNAIMDNPTGPPWNSHSEAHVYRGGCCFSEPTSLTCSARYYGSRSISAGFRCVRRPSPL